MTVGCRGIIAIPIIQGIIVAHLGTDDPVHRGPARAGTIHIQSRKCSAHRRGIKSNRTLPIARIPIQGYFVRPDIPVHSRRHFVILKPAIGWVRINKCLAPHDAAGHRVPVAQAFTSNIAIRIKARCVHQVNADNLRKETGKNCIRRGLQIFLVASNEERLPVLGKHVVDEQEITRSPRQNLAANLKIQRVRRIKQDIRFTQVDGPLPFLKINILLGQNRVVEEIRSEL